jgi:hypothetical protein
MRSRRLLLVLAAALLGLSIAAVAHGDWPRRSPPPPSTTGLLLVISRPWSNVKVDGRRLGPTPVRVELAPGRHRLELKTGDQVHRERVTIRAAKTVRVMHRF